MLHKGKLQAALQLKKNQFTIYDGSFSDQLYAYRHALETLHQRYLSSQQLEDILPPDGSHVPAGARPSIEFDRWLASVDRATASHRLGDRQVTDLATARVTDLATARVAPTYAFGRTFANHEQARE